MTIGKESCGTVMKMCCGTKNNCSLSYYVDVTFDVGKPRYKPSFCISIQCEMIIYENKSTIDVRRTRRDQEAALSVRR